MSVKKQQHQVKFAVDQNSEELKNLREYLGRKPKDPIVLIKNFNVPGFPIERVASVNLMDSACQNTIS